MRKDVLRMRVNLDEILPQGITIINRLDKSDRTDGGCTDELYTRFIPAAQWNISIDSAMGDQTLSIGGEYRVQIPKESEGVAYQDYKDWKAAPAESYTCRVNDIIVKGAVAETVDIDNYKDVIKAYRPNVFTVGAVDDKRVEKGLYPQSTTGAMRFLEFIYAVGV